MLIKQVVAGLEGRALSEVGRRWCSREQLLPAAQRVSTRVLETSWGL